MSSPSDNSTMSSSGRSSPDDGVSNSMNSSFPRRSSTPAQSFLAPRFWAQPSSSSSSSSGTHHDTSSFPRRTSFGTTFSNGGRLSALSALGMSPHTNPALYGFPNTNTTSNSNNTGNNTRPGTLQQQQQQQSRDGSQSRDLSPANSNQRIKSPFARGGNFDNHALSTSADSTPTPSVPSSPIQRSQKRTVSILPGPDGLCVESRGRRRSEA